MMCLSLPFTLSALERDKDGYCLIHNAEELAQYRDSCKSNPELNGRLAADIDLNKVCGIINGDTINWEPINSPKSSFDGANHTISNFYYNSPNSSNVGFFSEIKQVDNLILKNAYVKGDKDIVGFAKAKKINNWALRRCGHCGDPYPSRGRWRCRRPGPLGLRVLPGAYG